MLQIEFCGLNIIQSLAYTLDMALVRYQTFSLELGIYEFVLASIYVRRLELASDTGFVRCALYDGAHHCSLTVQFK